MDWAQQGPEGSGRVRPAPHRHTVPGWEVGGNARVSLPSWAQIPEHHRAAGYWWAPGGLLVLMCKQGLHLLLSEIQQPSPKELQT